MWIVVRESVIVVLNLGESVMILVLFKLSLVL